MKKTIFLMIMLCMFLTSVFGQQITTVAVIDAQRVYDSFAKGDSLNEGISSVQLRYQDQIDDQLAIIRTLETQKESLGSSNIEQSRIITGQISTARAEIDRLSRLRTQEIKNQRQFVAPNNFIPQLQRAVIFVAESKGYTVVFNADAQGLQWWSPIVDISDDVIARLIVQLSR